MTGPKRVTLFVVVIAVGALLVFLFGGCALVGKGRIKGAGVTVQAPKDGNGATLASDTTVATMTLPAGSKLTTVKFDAVPATLGTDGRPAFAAQPAREETTVVLSRDTAWRKDESKIAANTGSIDTSVARHRIDVASRQWLLYAAIACGIAGLVSRASFPAWPTLSNGLLMAAVAAAAAWKLAEIPWWAFLAVIGVAVLLIMGYKRREKDERDGDPTPASPTPKVVP